MDALGVSLLSSCCSDAQGSLCCSTLPIIGFTYSLPHFVCSVIIRDCSHCILFDRDVTVFAKRCSILDHKAMIGFRLSFGMESRTTKTIFLQVGFHRTIYSEIRQIISMALLSICDQYRCTSSPVLGRWFPFHTRPILFRCTMHSF